MRCMPAEKCELGPFNSPKAVFLDEEEPMGSSLTNLHGCGEATALLMLRDGGSRRRHRLDHPFATPTGQLARRR
jgi:hypothetical protein